jgi:hypothetical protein
MARVNGESIAMKSDRVTGMTLNGSLFRGVSFRHHGSGFVRCANLQVSGLQRGSGLCWDLVEVDKKQQLAGVVKMGHYS